MNRPAEERRPGNSTATTTDYSAAEPSPKASYCSACGMPISRAPIGVAACDTCLTWHHIGIHLGAASAALSRV